MKKIILFTFLSIVLFSCKNNENKSVETETVIESNVTEDKIFKGDFVYIADAAVLKGEKFIYGVTINELTTELANKVKNVKESEFDMVPVAVKGFVSPKEQGEEGWDEILTITEIVMVGSKPSKIDIKIEEKN